MQALCGARGQEAARGGCPGRRGGSPRPRSPRRSRGPGRGASRSAFVRSPSGPGRTATTSWPSASASSSRTSLPLASAAVRALIPLLPPPMTTTSTSRCRTAVSRRAGDLVRSGSATTGNVGNPSARVTPDRQAGPGRDLAAPDIGDRRRPRRGSCRSRRPGRGSRPGPAFRPSGGSRSRRVAGLERDRVAVDDDVAGIGRRDRALGHWRIRRPWGSNSGSGWSRAGRRRPMISISKSAPAPGSVGGRELRRHIAERDRLLDVVAVPARRHPADDLAVVPDRLVADDVGWRVRIRLDDHRHEAPRRSTGGHLGLVGRPTDEVVVEPEVARDPGLGRRVDRPVLAEPRPVALLQAERHQRPHPEQPQAVRLARGHDLSNSSRWYSGATHSS